MDRAQLRLLGDAGEVIWPVYVCGRDMDDPPRAGPSSGIDHAGEQGWLCIAEAQAATRGPRPRAVVDHLDALHRVGEGFVVGICV